MKPIFDIEKKFLENKLGIELPENCWKHRSKIYLNYDSKKPILELSVENYELNIKKNRMEEILKTEVNKTHEEEWEEKKDEINKKINISIKKTIKFILDNPSYNLRESISGGKDSLILHYIMQYVFNYWKVKEHMKDTNQKDYVIDFFNPTNDTADTYKHIKNDYDKERLQIHNPPKGLYQWLAEDKNYLLPSVSMRNCCSQYKEGRVKTILNKKENYIMFLGMRKYESTKRSGYDYDLNKAMGDKNNMPKNWLRFLPIVEFKDEEVWLLILHKKRKINRMYELGYDRVGCVQCPYSDAYADLLTKEYYPTYHKRWEAMVDINYEKYNVKNRLKWTKEEWHNGKWKEGTSKEYSIIKLKQTDERIQELADIKGIPFEVAKQYWKRVCANGDNNTKKDKPRNLNPDEVAMNMKLFGRHIGLEDRKWYCKKCICKMMSWTEDEYKQKVRGFRDQGCELF